MWQKAAANPNGAEAHYQLGKLAASRADFAEAVARLERAVALDTELAQAHYQLSLAYQRQGRREKAAQSLAAFEKLKRP